MIHRKRARHVEPFINCDFCGCDVLMDRIHVNTADGIGCAECIARTQQQIDRDSSYRRELYHMHLATEGPQ